jgi:hypothetical protein
MRRSGTRIPDAENYKITKQKSRSCTDAGVEGSHLSSVYPESILASSDAAGKTLLRRWDVSNRLSEVQVTVQTNQTLSDSEASDELDGVWGSTRRSEARCRVVKGPRSCFRPVAVAFDSAQATVAPAG